MTVRACRAARAPAPAASGFGGTAGSPPSGRVSSSASDARLLGLPARQHALAIVRLDPAVQKPRRHRQAHRSLVDAFELHAPEPAREDVLAEFGAQTVFDRASAPDPCSSYCLLFQFRVRDERQLSDAVRTARHARKSADATEGPFAKVERRALDDRSDRRGRRTPGFSRWGGMAPRQAVTSARKGRSTRHRSGMGRRARRCPIPAWHPTARTATVPRQLLVFPSHGPRLPLRHLMVGVLTSCRKARVEMFRVTPALPHA